ncbi:MAG TPA: CbbQ/NirQ/NorQ/GpvN family protein [Gemmatimonadaceae bacterium]|nr:CbbQ/NirQ/NorQ/GpvN family protein [Gemmatimonadaceae bacterium]
MSSQLHTVLPPPAASEPYYVPRGTEREVFLACDQHAIPILLKGPTGCGKTRFVEHMAWRLRRSLITVACHDDLSASDLTGRFLLRGDETVWIDGPLTTAVRAGAICYLDEVIEARADTLTVLHPLADERRLLPLDKTGELLHAAPGFLLVVSYNPGYQRGMKELKNSFRQRFAAFDFDYPDAAREREIVAHEGRVDAHTADRLVRLAQQVRRLKEEGLPEGAGTRSLVAAARLIAAGVSWKDACSSAIGAALTDDPDLGAAIRDLIAASGA